jgi:tRNA (guanine37-N1)-methyltransferase
MKRESVCFKVPRRQCEKALTLIKKLKIIDRQLKIDRDDRFVLIPLATKPSARQLKGIREQITDFDISKCVFHKRKPQKLSPIEALEDDPSPELSGRLPRSMDVVGDIAIVEIPSDLDAYKQRVGEAIIRANPSLNTVVAKASAVRGTYRLREFIVIAGEHKTETIHKEYGCKYYVDISKAFFSPRLSHEHKRIASLVKEKETIVDLFAGVGPFAIQIAKTHEKVEVYALDLNPNAFEYLERNIRLNKVLSKVRPIFGDAKQIVKERLSGVADRVIMNLPWKSLEFVDAACQALKQDGGIVHLYSFVKASSSLEELNDCFARNVEECKRRVLGMRFSRVVREIAPYQWQAVLDIEIK